MTTMTLRIMNQNNITQIIRSVTRVASMNNSKYLYYETVNHMKGFGVKIPFDEVKCFDTLVDNYNIGDIFLHE